MLDTMNASQVLRDFEELRCTERETSRGRVRIEAHSDVDLASGTLTKRWQLRHPDGSFETTDSRVRLYAPHELAGLFRSAGFEKLRMYGGIDGHGLKLDSPRCILVKERP